MFTHKKMGAAFATPEPLPQELLVRIQAQAGELRQKKAATSAMAEAHCIRTQRGQGPRHIAGSSHATSGRAAAPPSSRTQRLADAWSWTASVGHCPDLGAAGVHLRPTANSTTDSVRFYHKKEGDYESQRTRDHIKDRLCEAAGVTLIRTPPRSHLCDSQLALYLCQQLAERRVLHTHS